MFSLDFSVYYRKLDLIMSLFQFLPEPSKGRDVALLAQTSWRVSLRIMRVFFSGVFLAKNFVTTVPLSS